jgi:hypothetical protein
MLEDHLLTAEALPAPAACTCGGAGVCASAVNKQTFSVLF